MGCSCRDYTMHQFREKPIPNLNDLRLKRKGARAFPLDLDAIENSEKAVDARERSIAGANYYFREDNPPYWHRAKGSIPELYVREGIIWRLLKANKFLNAWGLELYLFDAYRPVEVQNYFHDEWVPNFLRTTHPDWTEDEVEEEVGNYWAKGSDPGNPIDPNSPPPHSTGGVVDCTIKKKLTGEHLYMGTQFDEVHESAHMDYYERIAEVRPLTISQQTARENRRILYWTMNEVGMVNNPNEWWHYGYGDQLSAKLSDAKNAVYSLMHIP